ncbi:MAG: 4-hydroxybenzoate octaprenyltransferase, partial [Rhizobiaceae bacterium]
FTDWPQFFLGLAFSWGALMGWAGVFGSLSWAPIWLYAAAVAWTIGYDTIYAHQDKEDDALVGVRSTARLFGDNTKAWLIGLYGLTLVFLLFAYIAGDAGLFAYVGLIAATVMLAWQILIIDIDNPDQCLKLFKFNTQVGAVLFGGLILGLIL